MIYVKVAYNMEIVRKAKLANIYCGRTDHAQVWPRERLTITFAS